MKQRPELVTPSPEHAARSLNPLRRPLNRLCVGDRVPQVCYIRDVAAFFGISTSQAHRRHARGEFTAFTLPRLAGAPASFSGAKLIAWRDGHTQAADGLRFFQSARMKVARHGA